MKKFEFCEVFLRDDGIGQVTLYPNIDVLPEHVKVMVDTILELSENKPIPVVMFLGEFTNFGKEAREYSANPENQKAASALAYVINNFGHKLVINFYIRINKPLIPIKIFTDENSAITWLEKYK